MLPILLNSSSSMPTHPPNESLRARSTLQCSWRAPTTRVISFSGCVARTIVGKTKPGANPVGRLFSFQYEEFADERNLPKDIPCRQPPQLAFPDHVQDLVGLESSATLHRTIENLGWHSPAA